MLIISLSCHVLFSLSWVLFNLNLLFKLMHSFITVSLLHLGYQTRTRSWSDYDAFFFTMFWLLLWFTEWPPGNTMRKLCIMWYCGRGVCKAWSMFILSHDSWPFTPDQVCVYTVLYAFMRKLQLALALRCCCFDMGNTHTDPEKLYCLLCSRFCQALCNQMIK